MGKTNFHHHTNLNNNFSAVRNEHPVDTKWSVSQCMVNHNNKTKRQLQKKAPLLVIVVMVDHPQKMEWWGGFEIQKIDPIFKWVGSKFWKISIFWDKKWLEIELLEKKKVEKGNFLPEKSLFFRVYKKLID